MIDVPDGRLRALARVALEVAKLLGARVDLENRRKIDIRCRAASASAVRPTFGHRRRPADHGGRSIELAGRACGWSQNAAGQHSEDDGDSQDCLRSLAPA